MKPVNSVLARLAPIATALALATPATAATPSSSQSGLDYPDVQGTWAMKLVEVSKSKAPLIGDVTSSTITYLKVNMTQSQSQVRMTETACDVRVNSDQGAVTTHIPDRFVAHMNPVVRTATLQGQNGVWTLNAPKTYQYYGLRPSIGETAPLPHSASNKYVYDQDEDGHPGMTIRLSGLLSGQIYMIQRTWDELQGKLYKSGQWAGPVDWKTDQIVLQKTGRVFGEMSPSTPMPNKSYFQLVKVDNNATCKDIVQKKDKLF